MLVNLRVEQAFDEWNGDAMVVNSVRVLVDANN